MEQPTLGKGDSGEWVTYLQQMLEYHHVGTGGFEPGTYCDATERAVTTLQHQRGLAVTGQCDEATWTALTAEPLPEPSSEQSSEQSRDLPDDIAVSIHVQAAAPDEHHTLDHLDDLPGNAHANS